MKKITAFLLCLVFLVSFTGCGKGGSDNSSDDPSVDALNYIKDLNNLEEYIIVGQYLKVSVPQITVDDASVEGLVKDALAKYGTYEEVKGRTTVASGDNVAIDFVGYLDGVAFDGGTGSTNLIIGSGSFIPGFEDGLIGKEAGSTVSLNLTFPENYWKPRMAGKEVIFEVKINKIQTTTKINAELNDAFAKEHYDVETVDELYSLIREQAEEDALNDMMASAWKAALSNCEMIKFPEGIIDAYVDLMELNYTQTAEKNETTLEKWLNVAYGITYEDFKEQAPEYAKDYYKSEIAMYYILDENFGREISAEEYEERVRGYAEENSMTEMKLQETYTEERIKTNIYWDKVMELIWDNAVLVAE